MSVSKKKLKFAEFELSDDGLRRNGVLVPMNAQTAITNTIRATVPR